MTENAIDLAANLTLDDLLDLQNRVDAGDEEVTREQVKELAKHLNIKVDAYKDRIDFRRARAKVLRARAREIDKAAKTLENEADQTEDFMKMAMDHQGHKKLPGTDFIAHRVDVKSVDFIAVGDPTSEDYRKHGDDLIKRTYEWRVNPVKAAYKKDPEAWANYCKPGVSRQLRWPVNKGVDK